MINKVKVIDKKPKKKCKLQNETFSCVYLRKDLQAEYMKDFYSSIIIWGNNSLKKIKIFEQEVEKINLKTIKR